MTVYSIRGVERLGSANTVSFISQPSSHRLRNPFSNTVRIKELKPNTQPYSKLLTSEFFCMHGR